MDNWACQRALNLLLHDSLAEAAVTLLADGAAAAGVDKQQRVG